MKKTIKLCIALSSALCIALTACGVDLEEYDGVKAMAAGGSGAGATSYSHTVAVKNDGTVWAWGYNNRGQLGDGTQIDKTTPVQVKSKDGIGFLEGVDAVFAGNSHTVALKNDGTVWAWGGNLTGQLGDGTEVNPRTTPVQVKGGASGSEFLEDVIAVAAGANHTVAVKNGGTVWAWGTNSSGQLGDDTTLPKITPVRVKGGASGTEFLEDVIAVFAGGDHTLAITGDGRFWAWGSNLSGQLGNDSIPVAGLGVDSFSKIPVRVKGGASGTEFLEDVIAVFAGGYHTLAITGDGRLWAWGRNNSGELGDGTQTNRRTPVQVKYEDGVGFLEDVIAVSGGNMHTIALKKNGTVWAWGSNNSGQLGKGDGYSANNSENWEPKKLGEASDLIGVAGGYNHSAALRRSGIVWTWGSNNTGQLGDGTNNNRSKPGVVRWK